jgi:hypothetical protein
MLVIAREPGELEVDQAEHDLRRGNLGAERQRPPRGDVLEQIDRFAVLTPAPVDQAGGARASASLSSTGSKPSARTAAITASLSALPRPVAWRLIVPTGTPRYGILNFSAQAVRCAR